MDLYETLKDPCRDEWQAYSDHPFPTCLAGGLLPGSAFRLKDSRA